MRKLWFLVLALLLAACTPGQFLRPTVAPTATTRPTATPTLTPSLTPTETSNFTPTVNTYPIDLAKLDTLPPSYADLVAHPENYVQAPDPLAGKAAFDAWWEKLIASVGDQEQLLPNVHITSDVSRVGYLNFIAIGNEEQPILKTTGTPQFFYYVKSDGTLIPVLIFTPSYISESGRPEPSLGTFAFILGYPKYLDSDGWDALKNIQSGNKIKMLIGFEATNPSLSPYESQLVASGLDWAVGSGPDYLYRIGAGAIYTEP